MNRIDINCDMGEGVHHERGFPDWDLMPWISSANIACGGHAGDEEQMRETLLAALEHGVQIGAHPGYPDREGFGRRPMSLKPEELRSTIKRQLANLLEVADRLGARVSYVKPHGALYHAVCQEPTMAASLVELMESLDSSWALMGLPGSSLERAAQARDLVFVAEGFADRRYSAAGGLVDRSRPDALVEDHDRAADQLLSLVRGTALPTDGGFHRIRCQSICVHGDRPQSLELLQVIDRRLKAEGIERRPFASTQARSQS